MKILVSNDDSYVARGVHALIDRMTAFGEVTAVCPRAPQSGQSMALTVNSPIRIERHEDYNGARMYSATGTPVDCIKIAMHHLLGHRPDIIVTGINHGSNAGINLLYSGTMGAAMEGATFGIPSIGFSLTDHSPKADFEPCFKAIDLLVEETLRNGLPEGVCLNVNIPNLHETPREMRVCTECRGRWEDEYKEYTDPYGGKFYWLQGNFKNLEPENTGTDEWALSHGMISVVPVTIDRSGKADASVLWLRDVCSRY